MENSPYVVGIDLGTTNSSLAYCKADEEKPVCHTFSIPQIVAAGEVAQKPLLPSFIYLAGEHEFANGALELPWGEYPYAVGEFAANQGAKAPDRLVSSAKSWLCSSVVDREEPILPWNADKKEVRKLSPVEASMKILMHLSEAWNSVHNKPDERLFTQSVFLTVPASFDAMARELTVKAAIASDMDVILIEEPQAALYNWLYKKGDDWRKELKVGDTVLVCDIGGGTTDFSLIAVVDRDGALELERIAVGNHLLLGGDNMDLTLAMHLSAKLKKEKKVKLDPWQLNALSILCRRAKEQLFQNQDLKSVKIQIPGRSSRLIGGAISVNLERELLDSVLVDGFFPVVSFDTHTLKKSRSGLSELTLPYESDPSISAHLAEFLSSHSEDLELYGCAKYPTAILFNGGVLKSTVIKERILQVLKNWYPENSELKVLGGSDLDLAVSAGAAYYGLARRGKGIRIHGGLSSSYYVGIESAMPAVPGFEPPLKAICLAPQGTEEGTRIELPDREFGLVVGEEAQFRFLYSSVRREDQVGDSVEDWDEGELTELPVMKTKLKKDDLSEGMIPVKLEIHVTAIGTIELWCLAVNSKEEKRWKLEFDIRSVS